MVRNLCVHWISKLPMDVNGEFANIRGHKFFSRTYN